MKKLIFTLAIFALASCNEAQQQKEIYKFYHADSNIELKNSHAMLNAMEDGKLFRLDTITGECSQYGNAK